MYLIGEEYPVGHRGIYDRTRKKSENFTHRVRGFEKVVGKIESIGLQLNGNDLSIGALIYQQLLNQKKEQSAQHSKRKVVKMRDSYDNSVLSPSSFLQRSSKKQTQEKKPFFRRRKEKEEKIKKHKVNETSQTKKEKSPKSQSIQRESRKLQLRKMRENIRVQESKNQQQEPKSKPQSRREKRIKVANSSKVQSSSRPSSKHSRQSKYSKSNKLQTPINNNCNLKLKAKKIQIKQMCSIASVSPEHRKFKIVEIDDYQKWLETHRKERGPSGYEFYNGETQRNRQLSSRESFQSTLPQIFEKGRYESESRTSRVKTYEVSKSKLALAHEGNIVNLELQIDQNSQKDKLAFEASQLYNQASYTTSKKALILSSKNKGQTGLMTKENSSIIDPYQTHEAALSSGRKSAKNKFVIGAKAIQYQRYIEKKRMNQNGNFTLTLSQSSIGQVNDCDKFTTVSFNQN